MKTIYKVSRLWLQQKTTVNTSTLSSTAQSEVLPLVRSFKNHLEEISSLHGDVQGSRPSLDEVLSADKRTSLHSSVREASPTYTAEKMLESSVSMVLPWGVGRG